MVRNLRSGLRQSLKPSVAGGLGNNDIFTTASLDLNFAKYKNIGSLVDFTRASSGTYVGSDGLIKTATTNAPRFDHDPTTGESLGLLVEEQRTNLLLYSKDFTTVWAAISGSTVDADNATAPDGTTTADKYSVGTSTFPQVTQSVATTVSAVHTLTVYAKAAGKNFVQIRLRNAGAVTNYFRAIFNLTDGSITQEAALGNGVYTSGSATDVGNGWWRLSMTGIADTSGTSATTLFILTHDANGTVATPSNSAATDGVLLWGAQLEEGSFPTSYIPTEGSTVTRAADVASISGTNFSSWYRQDEGTVFADLQTLSSTPSNYTNVFELQKSDNTDRMYVRYPNFVGWEAGGQTGLYLTRSFDQQSKLALGYKTNDTNFTANGSGITDSSVTIGTTKDEFYIGESGSGNTLNGTISRLTYWPTRLPNETLQTITN